MIHLRTNEPWELSIRNKMADGSHLKKINMLGGLRSKVIDAPILDWKLFVGQFFNGKT